MKRVELYQKVRRAVLVDKMSRTGVFTQIVQPVEASTTYEQAGRTNALAMPFGKRLWFEAKKPCGLCTSYSAVRRGHDGDEIGHSGLLGTK